VWAPFFGGGLDTLSSSKVAKVAVGLNELTFQFGQRINLKIVHKVVDYPRKTERSVFISLYNDSMIQPSG
jgi:hypothetical protein